MAGRIEPTERTALVARGDELARGYDVPTLIRALSRRLDLDGFSLMGRLIMKSAEKEASGPSTRAVYFAIALVGRWRVEGRREHADAVVSLLSGHSPSVDPVLWLNGAHAFIAMGREIAARYRARGLDAQADATEANAWTYLRSTLVERLHADGREELARAISAATRAFERQERGEKAPPALPSVTVVSHEPPAELVAVWAPLDTLARAHPADAWAHAAVTRLRAEGRDVLAASIMMWWARELAGPMVDPGQLAAELLAELRAQGREALAEALVSLLSGAAIDRDPFEIMTRWLAELSRPMVESGPLAAALVAALRNEQHEELADGVVALLSGAGSA